DDFSIEQHSRRDGPMRERLARPQRPRERDDEDERGTNPLHGAGTTVNVEVNVYNVSLRRNCVHARYRPDFGINPSKITCGPPRSFSRSAPGGITNLGT